jgi:hypothetical protein
MLTVGRLGVKDSGRGETPGGNAIRGGGAHSKFAVASPRDAIEPRARVRDLVGCVTTVGGPLTVTLMNDVNLTLTSVASVIRTARSPFRPASAPLTTPVVRSRQVSAE